ncbi:MAG: hypothetical protein NZ949_07760, partial [Candidatus Kapabacteria bacterium]|nr:hypothetical protein [Candidatus Kapabacteria bacterium]MDW7997586.1 histidine kinase dimerization/phospho-acceptor domain-containing protein [Bacteroidota bacterium]
MASLERFWGRGLWGVVLLCIGLGFSAAVVADSLSLSWAVAFLAAGALVVWFQQKRWRRRFRETVSFWTREIADRLEGLQHGIFSVRFAPEDFPEELRVLLTRLNALAETVGSEIGRVRKLERVRSDFLSNVSHELRNPLFALRGYLELLVET